jgi:hypothetical protein
MTVNKAQRNTRMPMLLMAGMLALGLALSACGEAAGSGQAQAGSTTGNASGQDSSTGQAAALALGKADLPLATQLALGTLQLEGTGTAVSQEQASELLFLWRAHQSLNASGTAAQVELDALVEQIQAAMTSEQLTAIAEMKLTGESMMAWVQENGRMLQSDASGQSNAGAFGLRPPQGSDRGGPPDGGMGGPPGGGMGAPGGGFGPGAGEGATGLTPEMRSTLQARRQAEGGGGDRLAQLLLEPLIEMLQSRLAG